MLTRDFLERLQTSSSPLGDRSQHSHMTRCVENESANGQVVNFLAHLHSEEYQHRSLNAYMHTTINGQSIGQHPLVSKLLKGAFQSHPPLPRYTETWDVAMVLSYLDNQNLGENLSLKLLSQRTLNVTDAHHLAKLDLRGYRNILEGAVLLPTALAKQSRPGKPLKKIFFPNFQKIRNCVLFIYTLGGQLLYAQLFISFIRFVTSSTIARWLKETIGAAGVDTTIFKAYSVKLWYYHRGDSKSC